VTRLGHYWKMWRSLPADDRRERSARLLERWMRQRPAIRRLGLVPDQPRWSEFHRALEVDPEQLLRRLRHDDPARGPLFDDPATRAATLLAGHPDHGAETLASAERVLDGRYDLLGSGPSWLRRPDGSIDWHVDWSSGRRWPAQVYHTRIEIVRGDGSDVKLPWELARFQHLLVLAQAVHFAPRLLTTNAAEVFSRRCAAETRFQIDDWIQHNPRGLGIHWCCAMEVALRAVTWLAVLALLRHRPEFDDRFLKRLIRSLWVHGRYIRRNLEIGSDGTTSNHYLTDLIGLYALGCGLPELAEAKRWRALAHAALIEEMDKQVHPDGVDYECSIPYHRLVTEIFLHTALLARHSGDELPGPFLQRLGRMLEFVASYSRLDGSCPQWGDNDDGRLLPLDGYATHRPNDHRHLLGIGGRLLDRDDLLSAAGGREVEACWLVGPPPETVGRRTAGRSSRHFPDARLFVMRHADLHTFVPAGPVGTGGVGNHTHNDLLSVSVWAGGVEWIVDPGSGSYSGDPGLRNRLRSTAAHATLQLERREQNEFGDGLDGLFRLGERARPLVEEWSTDGERAKLVARHSGFGRRAEDWIHERTVDFDGERRTWRILDRLWSGNAETAVVQVHLRFPLGPDVEARLVTETDSWPHRLRAAIEEETVDSIELFGVRLSSADASFWIALRLPLGSRVEIATACFSPRYGVTLETRCISATLSAASPVRTHTALWSVPEGSS